MATQIYRRYDDGYIDGYIVIGWYLATMTSHFPRDELHLCLRLFAAEEHGCFVDELNGKRYHLWISFIGATVTTSVRGIM